MSHGSTFILSIILGLGAAVFTGPHWIWPSLIGAVIIAVGSVLFHSKHYELYRDLKLTANPSQPTGPMVLAYIVLSIIQNFIFTCLAAGIGFLIKKLF